MSQNTSETEGDQHFTVLILFQISDIITLKPYIPFSMILLFLENSNTGYTVKSGMKGLEENVKCM